MITAAGLTKRFGGKTAVNDLSFEVRPGRVTGFLGPNGAGKSTTMRVLVGLTRPDSGVATVDGRRYHDLVNPGVEVGVLEGYSAIRGSGAAMRITFDDPADWSWAVETWRSLRPS